MSGRDLGHLVVLMGSFMRVGLTYGDMRIYALIEHLYSDVEIAYAKGRVTAEMEEEKAQAA